MTDETSSSSEPVTPEPSTEPEQLSGTAATGAPMTTVPRPPVQGRRNANDHSTPRPAARVDHEF